jgi:hypothetical protein
MSFNFSVTPGLLIQTRQLPLTTARRASAIQVKVYPQWYKQATVEWSIPASWGNCVFDVYFSQIEDSDFVKINATPIVGNHFIDTTLREESKFNHGYYVVEVLLLDKGGVALRSNPTTWKTFQRDWVTIRAIEIQRREYWLLSRFAGISSYLFRRKNYGKRCTTCWDPVHEHTTRDNCPNCIGTSFEGGYFTPAKIFLQYDPTPNNLTKNYIGQDEENVIGAWTISMPDIRLGDVIIRTGDWNAYEVTRIATTELQGNVVRQMLTLTQLSKGAVEFQLVTRDLPDFPSQYLDSYLP